MTWIDYSKDPITPDCELPDIMEEARLRQSSADKEKSENSLPLKNPDDASPE